jgi:hypothetical protein
MTHRQALIIYKHLDIALSALYHRIALIKNYPDAESIAERGFFISIFTVE